MAAARWLFVVACALALVGAGTRVSAPCAVLLGVFVLGVPQFFGKLNHDHHVLWFAAILAASRCGDALSFDGWRSGVRPAPDVAYGLPLRLCWVLVGVVYFFPGLWKAWVAGADWIAGDALRLHMHDKWLELRDFVRLVACYVTFVDWSPRARRLGNWVASPPSRSAAPVTVGALLVAVNLYCGFVGVDRWPFAVYLRFQYRPPEQRSEIVLLVVPADGSPAYVADPTPIAERMHSSRWVSMLRRIAHARGAEGEALRTALVEVFRANGLSLAPGDRIVFRHELGWIDPDRRAENPVRHATIASFVAR